MIWPLFLIDNLQKNSSTLFEQLSKTLRRICTNEPIHFCMFYSIIIKTKESLELFWFANFLSEVYTPSMHSEQHSNYLIK
jgi:hypothetical protein